MSTEQRIEVAYVRELGVLSDLYLVRVCSVADVWSTVSANNSTMHQVGSTQEDLFKMPGIMKKNTISTVKFLK